MKVILLRDVAKLGKRFATASVPDGYALNKLIPSGMAMAATPENMKKIGAQTEKSTATKESALADFETAVKALAESAVVITAEANAQDHLFQAVKAADIAAACAAVGQAIPVATIVMSEPIKALGEYTIPVELGSAKRTITINVVAKK